MPSLLLEYVLKGVSLGLLLLVALRGPDWPATGRVALATLAGLAVCLGVAAAGAFRRGYRARGRFLPFVLFLLLEHPGLVYAGTLLGLAAGVATLGPIEPSQAVAVLGGGVGLGVAFWAVRHLHSPRVRLGVVFALASVALGGVVYALTDVPDFPRDPTMFGYHILLAIPLFYLLTFAGRAEESEIEIGAMCFALGVGIWLLQLTPNVRSIGFLVPASAFFIYTLRILPGLRVLKHTLRGMGHATADQPKRALAALRRALQLDPTNALARQVMWAVHRQLDLTAVVNDPSLLELVDRELCLDRAASLLLAGRPTADQLAEAHRLLDLVVRLDPARRPAVDYWRAVAFTHQGRLDDAAAALAPLLDPAAGNPADPSRQSVLVQSWQLALLLHPELNRRVGTPQLALPGRRLEAIDAVERAVAARPDDPTAWDLKRLLYSDLSEAEYAAAIPSGGATPPGFDHAYAEQLGLALVDDPERWERGTHYLRLAARGIPERAVGLMVRVAQARQRAGDVDGARDSLQAARRAGQAVGQSKLAAEERQTYFAAVRQLAEDANGRGDLAAAIENYLIYAESERSGLETLRTLADLHERAGDPLSALKSTAQGLLYAAADPDLTARRDRYTYSVPLDHLAARKEWAAGAVDTGYCVATARRVLRVPDADFDQLDWAQHLVELVLVLHPEHLVALVLKAQLLLRRGERDGAIAHLEQARAAKPGRFAGGEDEDAWYRACQMLGSLYLEEPARPDSAIACLNDFRGSPKSGADTLYRLGVAHELAGDHVRARKFYEQVTSYEEHPLAPEAREAMYRLQART